MRVLQGLPPVFDGCFFSLAVALHSTPDPMERNVNPSFASASPTVVYKKKQDWFDALATMELDAADEAPSAGEQGLGNAGGGLEGWADALAAMGEMEAYEAGLGAAPRKQDWFDALATMKLGEEADEGPYAASDEDVNPDSGGSWADFLSKVEQAGEGSRSPVPTVSALDVNRYVGRWYQVREREREREREEERGRVPSGKEKVLSVRPDEGAELLMERQEGDPKPERGSFDVTLLCRTYIRGRGSTCR